VAPQRAIEGLCHASAGMSLPQNSSVGTDDEHRREAGHSQCADGLAGTVANRPSYAGALNKLADLTEPVTSIGSQADERNALVRVLAVGLN